MRIGSSPKYLILIGSAQRRHTQRITPSQVLSACLPLALTTMEHPLCCYNPLA